jgi:L,D-transpeptidase catalytic domain
VHRGTVRHWVKCQGLPVLTDRRPHLILGCDLVAFLKARRQSRTRKSARGELYCLKCRAPRKPVPGLLEYQLLIGSIESRTAGEPIMAIVSLRSQQITVYDSQGWILRAPISSGQKGRETPAGIFSVIQKDADHHSNLYDDAYMPHMQRLTWSGIALHGGPLPGHPASHGCVRMPYDFAERLFEVTKLGMRVIVAPNDVAPVSIAHPSLLKPKPGAEAAAAVRAAEAQEAAGKAEQARLAALAASRELAQTRLPVRATRNLKLRAEAQLAAAERAVDSAASAEAKEQAEQAKAEAATRVAELIGSC